MNLKQKLNIQVGDIVLVLSNPNNDDTFSYKYIGLKGQVKYFDYDCGCGQTYPNDPMIGVEFSNGEVEEFWKEELIDFRAFCSVHYLKIR
ncbi:hypothetical protein BWZ20_00025 [Winogradskyella sp. J14-2]|uniref:hypothetical protein n=1 Tax=Winogradskyella sp. J14-2 TaxID=1936080 RepID=UPI000972AADF|nr:hypothetical protein [Winogradskyella sp. J14-2]APY06780.1 hypothetical protein BWZ20_00025 [Winogradskyella sp. J14-2]